MRYRVKGFLLWERIISLIKLKAKQKISQIIVALTILHLQNRYKANLIYRNHQRRRVLQNQSRILNLLTWVLILRVLLALLKWKRRKNKKKKKKRMRKAKRRKKLKSRNHLKELVIYFQELWINFLKHSSNRKTNKNKN